MSRATLIQLLRGRHEWTPRITTLVSIALSPTGGALASLVAAHRRQINATVSNPSIIDTIMKLMADRDWSEHDLARESGLQVHLVRQLLSRRRPRVGLAIVGKLAKAFGMTPSQLIQWRHRHAPRPPSTTAGDDVQSQDARHQARPGPTTQPAHHRPPAEEGGGVDARGPHVRPDATTQTPAR